MRSSLIGTALASDVLAGKTAGESVTLGSDGGTAVCCAQAQHPTANQPVKAAAAKVGARHVTWVGRRREQAVWLLKSRNSLELGGALVLMARLSH